MNPNRPLIIPALALKDAAVELSRWIMYIIYAYLSDERYPHEKS